MERLKAFGGAVVLGIVVVTWLSSDWISLWIRANYTPCRTEDSTNCYWDAKEMGDGYGRSFVAYRLFDFLPDYVAYKD